jgi:hypothetical protein
MMFIKTVFALYLANIALAAPTPQKGRLGGGPGPVIPGGPGIVLGGGPGPVIGGLIGGLLSDRGGGGRLRTSCLNSRPLSTSLIRPS